MSDIPVSPRAARIEYAIRDVVVPAMALEKQGHKVIKLNIGDPIAYPGLPTPQHMVDAYCKALQDGRNEYSNSYGQSELRAAISADERSKGWDCEEQSVYVTTGVTEALHIIFAATLTEGTKVLAPGPHYPPYMAYPQLFGATTVEYRLKSESGWQIDFDDIESKMDDSVRLLVLINPNNPTGNVATPNEVNRLLDIAANWPNCIVLADEIYDGLDFTGQLRSVAAMSQQRAVEIGTGVPVIILNGVSKVYYAPGWRIGYMAFHDPNGRMGAVKDGVERLLRSRLCPSTPAQLGYLAGLTGDRSWMLGHQEAVRSRRQLCIDRINEIEGIEVEAGNGAFYMFVRLTDPKWAADDKQFVLDLLHEEHVLVVHGSGFSPEFGAGHFRLVHLADENTLSIAFDRIDSFLTRHRKGA